MIRRHSDVRRTVTDHAEHRREYASRRADLAALLIARGWQSVVVPEQLVGAVDEIDFQCGDSGIAGIGRISGEVFYCLLYTATVCVF